MKTLGIILLILLFAFGAACLEAWIVMLLWNWIAVGFFGAPIMDFWISFWCVFAHLYPLW